LGKAGAAFLFTLVTVLLNLSAFRLVLSLLAAGAPGGQPPPDSAVFGLILVMALPVMALAVTLQLAIAALARTLKEAQIYLGLLPLVPALPGIASAMTPLVPQLWTSGVPVFGQMLVFNRLIAGAPVEPAQALLSAVTTLLTAVLIFWWATRLYEQDRTVVAGG
jgi:sodium transport system permease protein